VDCSLDTRFRARRIDNHIRARPQLALLDQVPRIFLRAHPCARELVRRRVVHGELEALLVDIHGHDFLCTVRLRDCAAQQPHGASAKNDDTVARLDGGLPCDVDCDGGGFNERAFFHGNVLRELKAVVLRKYVVSRQRSIIRRRRRKLHIWAEIVLSVLAAHAAAARHTRLHRHAIPDFQARDGGSDGVHNTCGFVAEHHRLLNDEVPNAAFDPVVHVGAADAGPFWLDEDVMRGGECGDRAVFVCDFVGGLEDERGVLWWLLVGVNMRMAGFGGVGWSCGVYGLFEFWST
jgi:hypothetical protein